MWNNPRPAATAEWNCTRCQVTNRKLVAPTAQTVDDRCVHCGRKHHVTRGERPTRWTAVAA